jgi:hypothetical protein
MGWVDHVLPVHTYDVLLRQRFISKWRVFQIVMCAVVPCEVRSL